MNRLFKILTVALLAIITAFTCFGCTDSSKGDGETGLKYKKVDNGYIVSKFVDDGRDIIDLGVELAEIKDELGNGTRLIIAKNAFKGTKIKSLTIPDTVTEIKAGAFAGMSKLETLVVPFIGRTANASLEYQPDASEDKSANSARTFAHFFTDESFTGSVALTINYNETEESAVSFHVSIKLRNVIIQNSATEGFIVPMYAFNGCAKEFNYSFVGNLTAIGEGAFANSNTRNFTVPNTVEKIYKNAFANTKKLENLNLASATALTEIGEGAFNSSGVKNVVLPANLSVLGESAFAKSKVEEITLSENLTKIGNSAFYKCENLKNVYTDNLLGEIEIGTYAFANCSAFEYFGKSTAKVANTIDLTDCKAICSQAFDALGEEDEEYSYVNNGLNESQLKDVFGNTKLKQSSNEND